MKIFYPKATHRGRNNYTKQIKKFNLIQRRFIRHFLVTPLGLLPGYVDVQK